VCDHEASKTRRLKPATGLWKIQPQWVVTSGKQTTTTDILQLKIHADEMQLCLLRENTTIFSVMFRMVGDVHEFDIGLVINGTRNKWTCGK
jgi:hypothetical protein